MPNLKGSMIETSGRLRVVRIPPYGDINLSHFSTKVINCEVIQRLRYIRQAGVSLLDFPNAIHTRFEHVLGTYWNFMKIFENNKNILGDQYEKYVTQYTLLTLSHHLFEPAFSYASMDAVNAIWKQNWCEFNNLTDQIITNYLEPIKEENLLQVDLDKEMLREKIKMNLIGETPKEPLLEFLDLPFGPGKIDSALRDCYSLGFGEALGAQELINCFQLRSEKLYDLESGTVYPEYIPILKMTLGNLALLNGSIQANKTVAYRFFFSNPRRARNKLLSRLLYKYLLDENSDFILQFDKFLMFIDDVIYHQMKEWMLKEELEEFEYVFSNFYSESQKISIPIRAFSKIETEIKKLSEDYDSLVKLETDIEQQMDSKYKIIIDLRNLSKEKYWGFDKYNLLGLDAMEINKSINVLNLHKGLRLKDKPNEIKSYEEEELLYKELIYIHICSKNKIDETEKERLFKKIEDIIEAKLKIPKERKFKQVCL